MPREVARNKEVEEGMALGIADYLAIARRRIHLILLFALGITIATVIVVWRLPNLYRAETMILVDPQQVPNSYVASTVSTNISDRLSTIQQEVTSPSRLKRLIDNLRLSRGAQQKSDQEMIAEMQQAITVQVVEQGGRGLSAFRVGYRGKDPQEVAAVANQLAEMFISENLKVRERQSYGTAEFLDEELRRTKEQLDQKQEQLNEVKSKYMLDLPESKQYHLETLTTLRTQLQASQDRVNQQQQQKVYLQSMAMTQAPTVDLDTSSGYSIYLPQIQKLEGQLSALKAHYGDNHPDVRKLTSELNELKAKEAAVAQDGAVDAPPAIKEANSGSKSKLSKNPVLASQMQKLEEDIEKEKTLQADLQQQIAFHVSKLEKIPVFEQRISGMMWDYDSLRNHYSELESKKLSADMSSALETHEKGERFVVLDRAIPPGQPYAPRRMLISFGALLAGLGIGLGLAVLKEMTGNHVYSRAQVLELVGNIPVLADIPRIGTARERLTHNLRFAGVFLATAAGSTLAGIAISFFLSKA